MVLFTFLYDKHFVSSEAFPDAPCSVETAKTLQLALHIT